jgi:hypothetical protein
MSDRGLAYRRWAVPGPAAALRVLAASRGLRSSSERRDIAVGKADERRRITWPLPGGPLPHAAERLSLWTRVELLSRI